MMQNAEKLKDNLCEVDNELNENAVVAISNAIRSFKKYKTVVANILREIK